MDPRGEQKWSKACHKGAKGTQKWAKTKGSRMDPKERSWGSRRSLLAALGRWNVVPGAAWDGLGRKASFYMKKTIFSACFLVRFRCRFPLKFNDKIDTKIDAERVMKIMKKHATMILKSMRNWIVLEMQFRERFSFLKKYDVRKPYDSCSKNTCWRGFAENKRNQINRKSEKTPLSKTSQKCVGTVM